MNMGKIELKTYFILSAIAIIMLITAAFIFATIQKSKQDAEIVNALGRQRMLTQAMAKSVLNQAMIRDEKSNNEQHVAMLNRYITSMRKEYTRKIVATAKYLDIPLSMSPDQESLPYPATFTREVNDLFGRQKTANIAIIAPDAINPQQKLQDGTDRSAYDFLKQHPEKMFTTFLENNGSLIHRFYTSDRATAPACVSCHQKYQGEDIKLGDILGIRRFDILFTRNIPLGKQLLKSDLQEYEQAKDVFTKTLRAVKSGGDYPKDLVLRHTGHFDRIDDQAIQNKIGEVEQVFAIFQQTVEHLLSSQAGSDVYRQALLDLGQQANQLRKLSNDLVSLYTAIAEQNNQHILQATIAMVVVVLSILLAAAFYFKKTIINRINKTYLGINDIAQGQGELTRRLNDNSDDELGQLARAFDLFIDKTHKMTANISNEIDLLTASARKTETIAGKTAAAIHQQQSETQQLAQAIDEMAKTINEVASNATHTEQETQKVDQSMHASMEIVGQAVKGIQAVATEVDKATSTLNELEAQSDSIGSVLDVIKGIAEQTNLLALNAAIEAARAGEQGRGFAVVADEVRTLARRTQESTLEIQDMIERVQAGTKQAVKAMHVSKEKVTQNVEQSNKAGEMLADVSTAVGAISQMNAQIASATEEQSATTAEINRNINNIIEAVQQSAESSELADKATEDLKKITEDLYALVRQFKI